MAAIGKRGRGVRTKKKGASSTPTVSSGPSWKPAKSSTTGNYGKAVSAAAHTRNAARKSGPSLKVTPARTPDAPSPGGPGKVTVPRGETPRPLKPPPTIKTGRQTGPGVDNPPAIRAAKKFRAAGGNIGAETVLARRAASKTRRRAGPRGS